MKKITLASFIFMVMLVTGVSALVIQDYGDNGGDNPGGDKKEKNSQKAKDDLDMAKDALEELKTAKTDSDKCKAYAKVFNHCKMVSEEDDDSSDVDDSSSDAKSTDNVSDYKTEADDVLEEADRYLRTCMMGKKTLNCEQEIECEKVNNQLMYNINGDDNSDHTTNCGDGTSDDKSSDNKSSDDS